jgi:hypothetical protein
VSRKPLTTEFRQMFDTFPRGMPPELGWAGFVSSVGRVIDAFLLTLDHELEP